MAMSFQERVETIFADVLAQPTEVRSSYLAARCASEPELYREVASLLAAHEEADAFLANPAIASVETAPPLERIGPYRVLEELGHGGMGTVFLAERADGQYEQQVAIKVVRGGLGAEVIARRLQAERQILARLQHPHIATLHDGGTTDDGRPYLVMEYIDGTRIDTYCRNHNLSVNQRIALFRTVCEAVQYAHQHFIVHRDLKPDNILITAEGTVKLLDFGIAKLLDAEPSTDPNHPTTLEMSVLTPEYASPEQILGHAITTASDVYSLGVMLYELLSGSRPPTSPIAAVFPRSCERCARRMCALLVWRSRRGGTSCGVTWMPSPSVAQGPGTALRLGTRVGCRHRALFEWPFGLGHRIISSLSQWQVSAAPLEKCAGSQFHWPLIVGWTTDDELANASGPE